MDGTAVEAVATGSGIDKTKVSCIHLLERSWLVRFGLQKELFQFTTSKRINQLLLDTYYSHFIG